MAAGRPRQLVLDLAGAPSLAREDFLVAPSNADALAAIERWPDWPGGPALLLVGPPGAGKSHLAAIWAARSAAPILPAARLEPAVAASLAEGAALAVEDVDMPFDERALFHILNAAREAKAWLLLTASAMPAVALPDLASRLRALPAVGLAPPDEDLLAAIVVKLFADRAIEAEPALVRFLLSRAERSVAALRRAVAEIDAAALAAGRPVTRALAADVLRRGEQGG